MPKISVRHILPMALRTLVFAVLSLAPPIVWFFVTDAGGPLWLPIAGTAAVGPWAVFGAHVSSTRPIIARVYAAVAVTAWSTVAIVFLVNAVIIPFSAYVAWFDRLQQARPGGSVAYVFLLAAAMLSNAGAVLVVGSRTFVANRGFHRALGALFAWAAGVIVPLAIALGDSRLMLAWVLAAGAAVVVASGKAVLGAFVLVSVAVGIPALAIRDSLPAGSALVDNSAAPFFRRVVVDFIPNYPLIFSIPGYGFGHNSSQLGGRPVLSAGPVFNVEAVSPGTYYLRSAVFTRYFGDAWGVSQHGATVDSEEEEGQRNSIVQRLSEAGVLSSPAELRITIRTELYQAIPHTLDTVAYRRNGGTWQIITPSMRAGGIAADPPLSFGDVIELQLVPPSFFVAEGEAPSTVELASDVPAEVSAAAREAARAGFAPTINAVLELIRRDTSYSLDVPDLPQGGDIVLQLLSKTKAGYCVHYAGAFCVLSALNDIPVRYVTGILVAASDEYFDTEVTGFSSHAWAEVFDPAGYWRVVEATPPMQADGGRFRIARDRYTQAQLAAALARPQPGPEESNGAGLAPWLPPMSAAIVLAIVLGVSGFVLIRRRTLGIRSLGRRVVEMGEKDDIPPPTVDGWTEWQNRAARRYTSIAAHVRRCGSILQERAFAGRRPRKIDRSYLSMTVKQMRRVRRQSVNRR